MKFRMAEINIPVRMLIMVRATSKSVILLTKDHDIINKGKFQNKLKLQGMFLFFSDNLGDFYALHFLFLKQEHGFMMLNIKMKIMNQKRKKWEEK